MPRGVQQQQMLSGGMERDTAGQYNAQANKISGLLTPNLQSEITNPQGFSTQGLNAMNTANLQGVGGATAGAVGQGNLEAARTRNPGGFTQAADESARAGMRQVSQNALNTQVANEMQRQKNQQAGYGGMERLYGIDTDTLAKLYGLSNNAYAGASESSARNNPLGWAKFFANELGTPGPAAALGLG